MHDHKTSILWFFAFAGVLLSSAAWADGYLNDRATTEKLGGVGNYLFYHSPSSSETAPGMEDGSIDE